jgi:hypothetical protein
VQLQEREKRFQSSSQDNNYFNTLLRQPRKEIETIGWPETIADTNRVIDDCKRIELPWIDKKNIGRLLNQLT